MPRFLGEMKDACLENLSSDPSATTTGRIYHNTTTDQVMVDNGTSKRALLRNDGKCLFGTSGTAANNVRLHRGSSGLLQFVTGNDTTAELSLSTSLAQVSARIENSTTGTLPSTGNAGRIVWATDTKNLMVDSGSAFQRIANSNLSIASPAAFSTYSALVTDDIILCSTTTTVNLFTAVGNTGKQLTLKKIDTTQNPANITITPFGSETIDGLTSLQIPVQNNFVTLVSDGANWKRVASQLSHFASAYTSTQSATNNSLKQLKVDHAEVDLLGLMYNDGTNYGFKAKETGFYKLALYAHLVYSGAPNTDYGIQCVITSLSGSTYYPSTFTANVFSAGVSTLLMGSYYANATVCDVTAQMIIPMAAGEYVVAVLPSSSASGTTFSIGSNSRMTFEKIG